MYAWTMNILRYWVKIVNTWQLISKNSKMLDTSEANLCVRRVKPCGLQNENAFNIITNSVNYAFLLEERFETWCAWNSPYD